MKRGISILLSVVSCLALAGCSGTAGQASSGKSGESTAVTTTASTEPFNANVTLADTGATPKVSGTFIQHYQCDDWSLDQWRAHYDSLLEADIHMVILQWVAETPNGKFQYISYPSETAEKNKAGNFTESKSLLENALKAAQEKGIKVLVGLNISDEWWDNKFTSDQWRQTQMNLGNAVAKETYDLYKSKYPDAFYGWYWAWEFYNNTSHYENDWAKMMNPELDYLTSLDKSLPLLFSPYISKYITTTPAQLETQWTSFFDQTHFRDGDIFCSQDSVGASGLSMDYLEKQIVAMKKASLKKPGLKFWINCESFVGENGDGPAPLDRFEKQLKMASQYADTLITYSYSEFYSPQSGHDSYHQQYLQYIGKK